MLQTPLPNPYIAGNAVGGDHGFFGRQDILREVERVLARPDDNAIVLYGQRRVGKTSILLQLLRRLSQKQFLPIYFDLMDKARLSIGEVLYELAITTSNEIDFPVPEKKIFENDVDTFRKTVLPQLYKVLEGGRRPVFLLDEFDVLDLKDEQHLSNSAASKAFRPYLRELMNVEKKLGFVFVVGRRMDELSIDFSSTFKAAMYQQVSVLSLEEARTLILQAEKNNALTFDAPAVNRILEITRGHPYLTQLICQILFDRSYDLLTGDTPPRITVEAVESAIPKVLEVGSNAFQWIWGGLPPAERIIFSAIASKSSEQVFFSEDDIMAILQDAGIRILMRELNLAPQTLVNWQMLEQIDGGYRFFIDLIRQWVAINKPLNKVKDELDRINPLAENLYQTAQGFHQQGNNEQAIVQLTQALKSNPNHLKARLLFGTILRDENRLKESVLEFETAFELDEREGRFDLLQTLLQLGDSLEKENDEDGALAVYERVFSISPREQTAHDHKNTIWEKRGDREIQSGNLISAIESYEKSGSVKKLTHAKAQKLMLDIEEAAKEAERYESKEDWASALLVYNNLIELSGNDSRWQQAQIRALEEKWLAERYIEGAGYIRQKEWRKAQKPLAEIINKRPDYKDTPQLLVTVNQRIQKSILSLREIRLLALGVMVTLVIGIGGYLGFTRAQKINETNMTMTANAVQSQMLTSTQQADPDLYDNFDDPSHDGAFNVGLWNFPYEPPSHASQQEGVLIITQENKMNDQTAVIPIAYNNIQLGAPTFFEAKMKIDSIKKFGWAIFLIDFYYSSDAALTDCRINDAFEGFCEYVDTPGSTWDSRYETSHIPINDNQFHTFRIEIDPINMAFTYYLDNTKIGSYTPSDGSKFKSNTLYTTRIGVANWSGNSTSTLIGYFDDFRAGLIK